MSASTGPLAQLRLGPAGPDRWSGGAGAGADRIVAGLLGAQATSAAGRTVDTRSRWVHAVHVTHLAEGDPGTPGEHRVEQTHDSEHTAVRVVPSVQRDTPLAGTNVTFAGPRPGAGPTPPPAAAP